MTLLPWTPAEALTVAEDVVARCRVLAGVTDVAGETTRTFLSDGMRRANAQVAQWMAEAGMKVHTDDAGNLHGMLPGTVPHAATFALVSHLDTVPNAGAFDGVLGVLLAIALASYVGEVLPFPLRVIAFSEEEGVRFGVPFLGSRAVVGELGEALLRAQDRDGTTVREAIERYGLRCDDLPAARLPKTLGSLEFHIEQGPLLETESLPLGVVESVAGQSRFTVVFTGQANHAGTTPMHLRRDALTAAAAWVVQVEATAQHTPGLVATVGSITASPGARNVISGRVQCTLDVRAAKDAVRLQAADELAVLALQLGEARGVTVTVEDHREQAAVPMDAALTVLLEEAVRDAGLPVRRMTSGAGHDSMILAPHLPAAMLFLRTPGGLSHHPEEQVLCTDVAAALRVGLAFLQRLELREGTA